MSDQPQEPIWERVRARLEDNPLLLVYGGAAGFAVLVVTVILVLVFATGGDDGETVSGDPTGQPPSPTPTSTLLATSTPLATASVTPTASPTTSPTATPDGPLPSFAPPSDEPTSTPSPSPTPGETPAPTPAPPPQTGSLAPGAIAVAVIESCVQPAVDEPIQCSYTLSVSTGYEVSALPAQIECRIRSQVPAFSPLEPDTQDLSALSGLVTVSPRAVAQFDPPDTPKFSLPTLVECFLQVPAGNGTFRNLDSALVPVSLPGPDV